MYASQAQATCTRTSNRVVRETNTSRCACHFMCTSVDFVAGCASPRSTSLSLNRRDIAAYDMNAVGEMSKRNTRKMRAHNTQKRKDVKKRRLPSKLNKPRNRVVARLGGQLFWFSFSRAKTFCSSSHLKLQKLLRDEAQLFALQFTSCSQFESRPLKF